MERDPRIRYLRELAPAKKESGANVIERLEEALALAREGKIQNVVIACTTTDDCVMRAWANGSDPFVMAGLLEDVKLHFIQNNIERV